MNDVTGLVLTFNEAPNIARTLGRLSWLRQVIVVDSESTDGTADIAATFANVRVVRRAFTTHSEQWNYGLRDTGISTEWVLALDADYGVTDAAAREIQSLSDDSDAAGYAASFTYCIGGRPLRSAAYPPVTVLYKRARAHYEQDGHTQRVRVDGPVRALAAPLLHDDRKPLDHWLAAQARYMKLEADKLASGRGLGVADRVRRWIVLAPPLMFVHCYVLRGGILDGRVGLFYALQRAAAELILSLFLVRRMLDVNWRGGRTAPGGPADGEAARG